MINEVHFDCILRMVSEGSMDIEWLRTFAVAAEEGNFHRAAERLHLAQTTVTQHVQKLETIWGVKLFERVGRGVRLSRAGLRFVDHARRMLAEFDMSREDMARFRQGFEQTLRVCASSVVATTWLPRLIAQFARAQPGVELMVQVIDSEGMLGTILAQQADLGLSRVAAVHPEVHSEVLQTDPVVFIAPRDEFDFDGPVRTCPDLLERYPLFIHHHPGYWDDLLIQLRSQFPTFRTISVDQGLVAQEWVAERLGVSFFALSTVRKAILRGVVEQIPFPWFDLPTAHTYLVTPLQMTPLAAEFVQCARTYVGARGARV